MENKEILVLIIMLIAFFDLIFGVCIAIKE